MSNQKQLATAMLAYVADWDDRLPPAAEWELVVPEGSRRTALTSCPARTPQAPHAYAFNTGLEGMRAGGVVHPEAISMLFDSSLNLPHAHDHGESFLLAHDGWGVVTYADGHVKSVKQFPRP